MGGARQRLLLAAVAMVMAATMAMMTVVMAMEGVNGAEDEGATVWGEWVSRAQPVAAADIPTVGRAVQVPPTHSPLSR